MASLNRVLLAGNLTRDPEVRYTATGTARAELNLAVNRKFLSDGQWKEETCFIGVVVWGRQAEVCREHLAKGAPVLIEGWLQLVPVTPEGGEKHNRHVVRAERVQFLGRVRGELADAPARAGPAAEPAAVPPAAAAPSAAGTGNEDDLPF